MTVVGAGAEAVRGRVPTLGAGRSSDRIADHTATTGTVGARIRHLTTGDPAHGTTEIR